MEIQTLNKFRNSLPMKEGALFKILITGFFFLRIVIFFFQYPLLFQNQGLHH